MQEHLKTDGLNSHTPVLNGQKTYILSLENYYDSQKECYRKIITIDREPNKLLKSLIKKLNHTKLSPFKSFDNCCDRKQRCLYAICNPHHKYEFMSIEELPELFSWLVMNGYTINTSITKMLQNSEIRLENKMICFINE